MLYFPYFTVNICVKTGQMAQVVRRSLLVQEVWSSNPEPVKSPTHCQQLATVCVGLGAKPRRWAPLTRNTRKGIKRV